MLKDNGASLFQSARYAVHRCSNMQLGELCPRPITNARLAGATSRNAVLHVALGPLDPEFSQRRGSWRHGAKVGALSKQASHTGGAASRQPQSNICQGVPGGAAAHQVLAVVNFHDLQSAAVIWQARERGRGNVQ